MPPIVASLLGIVAILAIAFALSNGKRRISLRIVGSSFALQALLALGYNDKEAAAALKALPKDVGVSDGIKLALKSLAK